MGKKILIIDAHPDATRGRLVHALADAYAKSAEAGGHLVQIVRLCDLEFPWLRSASEFSARPKGMIGSQQEHFRWANHVVILYCQLNPIGYPRMWLQQINEDVHL
jgi:putative NADPH-quinone reductase